MRLKKDKFGCRNVWIFIRPTHSMEGSFMQDSTKEIILYFGRGGSHGVVFVNNFLIKQASKQRSSLYTKILAP